MSEFAEPYAARVIAIMLGLPEDEWPIIAREAANIGLAMGVTIQSELPTIEAALERLYAYADALIDDRRANPKDDFVSTLEPGEPRQRHAQRPGAARRTGAC